jgi:hypothetical protein
MAVDLWDLVLHAHDQKQVALDLSQGYDAVCAN